MSGYGARSGRAGRAWSDCRRALPSVRCTSTAPGSVPLDRAPPRLGAGPEAESPGDWEPDVGCVAWAAPDGLLLIDPLVERLGRARRARRAPRPDRARRDHPALPRAQPQPRRSVRALRRRRGLARRVEAKPIPLSDETMFWLDEPRALVCGDRLMGDDRGGVRMCPESWLSYLRGSCTLDQLRDGLRPLLELPRSTSWSSPTASRCCAATTRRSSARSAPERLLSAARAAGYTRRFRRL